MNNSAAYLLECEPDGLGCPYFIAEECHPAQWEWDNCGPEAGTITIVNEYSSRIIDPEIKFIDFDYYGTGTKYVSSCFVNLCNNVSANFRVVPIDIRLFDLSAPEKEYFIFLPIDHLALLDLEKSEFEVERVVETGGVMMNRFFPNIPFFSKIDKFVLKNIILPPLFECVELGCLVCNEAFRTRALQAGLRGVKFICIDESFTYDPWAGW